MNGFGRGRGFGFRGASPPWPYIGRGRGGFPRCGYWAEGGFDFRMLGTGMRYDYWPGAAVKSAGSGQTGTLSGNDVDQLRKEAALLKSQLEQIDARMKELESTQ